MTSAYQLQLDAKIARISAQFAEFNPPSLEVFQSPEQNFRMRAEFRIWHTEDDMFYAMFERNEDDKQKTVVRIDEFPIADQSINDLMPKLKSVTISVVTLCSTMARKGIQRKIPRDCHVTDNFCMAKTHPLDSMAKCALREKSKNCRFTFFSLSK